MYLKQITLLKNLRGILVSCRWFVRLQTISNYFCYFEWCWSCFDFYQQDCTKCKLLVLNLLTGWKSGFLPQGQLVAPIHMKLGVANRHVDPLGCANKFHLSRCLGGNPAHKCQKFPLSVKNHPHWQTPWPISNAHHYPAKVFKI